MAYERIAQLFDSPNAPDIVVNPKAYAFGRQPGQHGALDVIQSRSPLIFSGPGIKRGMQTDVVSRQIDIAPTIAKLCGFPLIDGMDETGRTSSQRGVKPDVYLKRQDGRPLDEIIDDTDARTAERAYIFLLDGFLRRGFNAVIPRDRFWILCPEPGGNGIGPGWKRRHPLREEQILHRVVDQRVVHAEIIRLDHPPACGERHLVGPGLVALEEFIELGNRIGFGLGGVTKVYPFIG